MLGSFLCGFQFDKAGRLVPRQTRAAGSGEASKFSSSDSGDDGTRSGGDGSRKRGCSSRSHEVRSRNVGTPGRSAPGPMRHPLKALRWLLLREQELLSYCPPWYLRKRTVCVPDIQRTLKVIVQPPRSAGQIVESVWPRSTLTQ